MTFKVIDSKTGVWADPEKIASTEDWASGLVSCDMDGFAIMERGDLVLMDECGHVAYCPVGRFRVIGDSMKIKLSFLDWKKKGKSIYTTEEGVELSMGIFHSGSTFKATIELEDDTAIELLEALKDGYQPCWWMSLDDTNLIG